METLKRGDLVMWDGIGTHFWAEPQPVRIKVVYDRPTLSYGFDCTTTQDHPDGPVPVRGLATHVTPEHLSREG